MGACKPLPPVKKVRLKEAYQKISDKIEGADRPVDTAKTPTLALTKKETKKEENRSKSVSSRTFYGIKTRRAYTRKGEGKKREVEIFFVTRRYQEPSKYIKDIYWYHRKKRKVFVGKIDPSDIRYARLLHGPYYKRRGRKVLEEGIYYLGMKHGRWNKYDLNNLLLDKRKFYKGWSKESVISYYDLDQRQPKEVIPVQYGTKDGDYFYFSEEGTLLKVGQYKENARVGVWTEYYPNKKPKTLIQYPKDPFSKESPYILKQFDEKNRVVYDFKKDGALPDSLAMPLLQGF